MRSPRIVICTIVLNETEWLAKLYEQHKDFPGMVNWVFVEGADTEYARTNPALVSKHGLSVDGTTDYLVDLTLNDKRITYIPHGFSKHTDKAQGKCEARNRYLEVADKYKPDYLVVIDADEFWPKSCQNLLAEWLTESVNDWSFSFKHREIWHPPAISDEPLFKYEVKGGFWDILYCRAWRWFPNLRYMNNHNTPRTEKISLDRRMKNHETCKSKYIAPYFVHMGFAGSLKMRKAKNEYYRNRGEAVDPKRSWYTDSRACFESWKPGERLPKGAQVVEYDGEIPECFLESVSENRNVKQTV